MNVALAAAFTAPGLAIGSFLNVVAARLPLRRSLVKPRSACMSCGTEIAGRDNIPVVSYLLLRGRCRHCKAKISLQYPAVELVTGLLVGACALRFGLTPYAVLAAGFCVVLVVLSAIDVERRIIPDRIVLPAALVVLVAQEIRAPSFEWPLAALAGALFLFIAAFIRPGGMGMGDVKLMLLVGAMLGRAVSVALMGGLLAALVPSAVLFAKHGRSARAMKIPLGPFLAIGAVVGLFAGHPLLHWYLGVGK